jgi:hypothetical protein
MKPDLLPSIAKDQLNLVLSFFARVDAKASVVLGVDTAMAGYLASRMPSLKTMPYWQALIPLTAFLLVGNSIWELYKGAFPNLTGGNSSLIFAKSLGEPRRNSLTSLLRRMRQHT